MGNSGSKAGLSYEEAKSRFNPREWAHLLRVYNQIADVRGGSAASPRLSLRAFREEVVGPYFIPSIILFRMFKAMGGEKEGHKLIIDQKNYMAGIALLMKGSYEEKLAFVFSMYDETAAGVLSHDDVLKMLRILQTSSLRTVLQRSGSRINLANALLRRASGASGMTLQDFTRMNSHKQLPALSRWIVDLALPSHECKCPLKAARGKGAAFGQIIDKKSLIRALLSNGNNAQSRSDRKINYYDDDDPIYTGDPFLWRKRRAMVSPDTSGSSIFGERELSALEREIIPKSLRDPLLAGFASLSSHRRRRRQHAAANYEKEEAEEEDGEDIDDKRVSLEAFVQGVRLCTREGNLGRVRFFVAMAADIAKRSSQDNKKRSGMKKSRGEPSSSSSSSSTSTTTQSGSPLQDNVQRSSKNAKDIDNSSSSSSSSSSSCSNNNKKKKKKKKLQQQQKQSEGQRVLLLQQKQQLREMASAQDLLKAYSYMLAAKQRCTTGTASSPTEVILEKQMEDYLKPELKETILALWDGLNDDGHHHEREKKCSRQKELGGEFERFAAVDLGVKPKDALAERRVILRILSPPAASQVTIASDSNRETKKNNDGGGDGGNGDDITKGLLSIGQTVYVVSAAWARKWARFIGINYLKIHAPMMGRRRSMMTTTNAISRRRTAPAPTTPPPTTASSSSKDIDELTQKEEEDERKSSKGGGVGSTPGRIQNIDILEESTDSITALRSGLVEKKHYIVVTQKIWTILSNWYGGGPMIPRLVGKFAIPQNTSVRVLGLTDAQGKGGSKSSKYAIVIDREFSFKSSRSLIFTSIRLILMARLWSFHKPKGAPLPMPVMLESELTLEEAGLRRGQEIVVEQQGKGNRWEGVPEFKERARQAREVALRNAKGQRQTETTTTTAAAAVNTGGTVPRAVLTQQGRMGSGGAAVKGGRRRRRFTLARTGLYNLGNTCFLNSALQCMAATAPLTRYFLAELYLRELNQSNPLGTSGQLALQYATLLQQLRRSMGGSPIPPATVRAVMAKQYEQFASYQQQDAQEFLSLLMDGLHEDLNRVLEKPYTQITDSNGRKDHIVAAEHIEGYLQRNRSVIVDLFCGVTKSTLEWKDEGVEDNERGVEVAARGEADDRSHTDDQCAQEGGGGEGGGRGDSSSSRYTSVKFEPFTMLSLPMPNRTHITIDVTLVYDNPSRFPLRLSVKVHQGHVYSPHTEWIRYNGGTGGSGSSRNNSNNRGPNNNHYATDGGDHEHDSLVAYEVPRFDERADVEAEGGDDGEGVGGLVGLDTHRLFTCGLLLTLGICATKYDREGRALKDRSKRPIRCTGERNCTARRCNQLRDRYGKWYRATVIDCDRSTGFDSQYDEDVSVRSGRIARLNTRATTMLSAKECLKLPHDVVQVVCMHRRLVKQPKRRRILPDGNVKPKIWSIPIVLFVKKNTTSRNLYMEVWKRTWRYAPSPLPLTINKQSVVMCPFKLRLVNVKGYSCARCPWDAYCIGMPLPEAPNVHLELADNVHIAVDWASSYCREYLNERAMRRFDVHQSRRFALMESSRHVDIGRCFKRFTEKERIKEVYCSQLFLLCIPESDPKSRYSLPPILVLHLKRLVQGGKIQSFVDFPINGFDPSEYLTASAKEGTVSVQQQL
eukprot:jgi/Bigna1/71681/fgenesh1_pg.16_\